MSSLGMELVFINAHILTLEKQLCVIELCIESELQLERPAKHLLREKADMEERIKELKARAVDIRNNPNYRPAEPYGAR